ncbi:MAG: zinc metalloprotease HtpX [Candidatus Nealsonbacteria bacterium CG23_combo_of_CG06-09_8_20_14_all_40_13]|uniref:Protease HtpX homolog n=1 Tax=Candidatus Nealsonbacteria bacterium CG23_combo_of_CG06-09_8_20_14_all_40_13 TaxID=1974724 RepID=A0A2G9YQV4_9BACT|nr:MAG: zinc metalloprotease HtpX [Candidatus Nealsonbacteria bacterium CG23_combo_of_CG06-09_8_20_14_all_40_13]
MYKQIDSNKRRTSFLLVLFFIFIIGLGYLFSYVFNSFWILFFAVVLAIIQAWSSYYYSDKITLFISGARELKREENVQLHRIIENLAITAGLPKPKIYLIEDSAPNAFATGRDPNHAVIAVTSGILEKLDKTELEGVIAHEFSHIGNYDIRLMTIVVVLVGIVALVSDWILRWTFWGGARRRSNGDSGQLQLIFLIIAIILAILAPLAAMLIQLAISRKREFLADASGAMLTRYPEGLALALEKISKDKEPLEVANKATAHLYIVNPLKEHQGKTGIGWFASFFMTHPPVEERIKALESMV